MTEKPEEKTESTIDDFDLSAFTGGRICIKAKSKPVAEFTIRKPMDSEFHRINPDRPAQPVLVYFSDEYDSKLKDKKAYLVKDDLAEFFPEKGLRRCDALEGITVEGRRFLYLHKLPIDGNDISKNSFESIAKHLVKAMSDWVRLEYLRSSSEYRTITAQNITGKPTFSPKETKDVVKEAFGENVIKDDSHSIIKKLVGA
jgi:hypothetical protein